MDVPGTVSDPGDGLERTRGGRVVAVAAGGTLDDDERLERDGRTRSRRRSERRSYCCFLRSDEKAWLRGRWGENKRRGGPHSQHEHIRGMNGQRWFSLWELVQDLE